MSTSMSRDERESFLADLHVAVIAIEAEDGPPVAVPIWYTYEPGGEVRVQMGRGSLKYRLIERTERFTLTVQDEAPPYRYVSVEGPVVGTHPVSTEELTAMAHRYLGERNGDRYVAGVAASAGDTVVVHMRPQRWRTVDYSKGT